MILDFQTSKNLFDFVQFFNHYQNAFLYIQKNYRALIFALCLCGLFSAVGTFARALDCSSSVRQPSLHMSAAAASWDITLVRCFLKFYGSFFCYLFNFRAKISSVVDMRAFWLRALLTARLIWLGWLVNWSVSFLSHLLGLWAQTSKNDCSWSRYKMVKIFWGTQFNILSHLFSLWYFLCVFHLCT